MALTKEYDVIVVGAGHAGVEAGLAAARMGCSTLMFTTNLDNIAVMNCNPSVGGPAKGHLVREIDALGGEMARAIDDTFIQIRMLNTGKGPAVRALRAQADKRAYAWRMRVALERQGGLDIKQGMVSSLVVEHGRVCGVSTRNGLFFSARAVVLSTGTYLEGKTITGEVIRVAGPGGQLPAVGLSKCLQDLGLELVRYKTGTPMRLDGGTVDYSRLTPQYGDDEPLRFSFMSKPEPRCQLPCWGTHTNGRTHDVIRANLHRAPLFSGLIEGRGPRYCPSVEDKIVRFADKESHQIFLEPEGWDTQEMYVLGLSTSLPEEVQIEVVRTIPGLEEAELMRAGYAIEYDAIVSTQLLPSLEVKTVAGLFCGGQINGTSGYEEAAAQGLMAGINAALSVQGREPVVLGRGDGYIGVLVDDLVTKGTREPYRMMTSRAEYRLHLRQDNAHQRLTPVGREVGLVDAERWAAFSEYQRSLAGEMQRLEKTVVPPADVVQAVLRSAGSAELKTGAPALSLLRRPQVGYAHLVAMGYGDPTLSSGVVLELETQLKYEGYMEKEAALVDRMRRLDARRLPLDIQYGDLRGLSSEAREKLSALRPVTLGQASRISGVSPADISVLLIYLEHRQRAGSSHVAEEGAN